jgi:hypothetical protein
MTGTDKINVHALQEEAKKSEDKEAFTVLARMSNCRVGVGVRLKAPANPVFFVEIIVSLCHPHHAVNLYSLEKNLLILKRLKERGYSLTCIEDGTVSCELSVLSQNFGAEIKTANSMIRKCLKIKSAGIKTEEKHTVTSFSQV